MHVVVYQVKQVQHNSLQAYVQTAGIPTKIPNTKQKYLIP